MAWPPATHKGIRDGIRDVPVSAFLPSNYVAGTTDIAPYVQAAADAIGAEGRGALLMPTGTHLWNSSVYLNAATRQLTYSIIGHGRGTYINLGAGLNNEYAIHLNENASGVPGITSPGFPRLVFRDMEVQGQDPAGQRGLVFSNGANVTMENLRLYTLYRACHVVDYVDLMTFRKIHWVTSTIAMPGSVMFWSHSNGDGMLIQQITAADNAVVADIANSNGVIVQDAIVGCYRFASCDAVEVIAPHNDGGNAASYQTVPMFYINSSRVAFRGGWDQIGDTVATFQIDDPSNVKASEVTFDGYTFGFRPHTADKIRAPHIDIVSAQAQTRLHFRHSNGILLPEGISNRYMHGPKMRATDPAIQAAIDAYPAAPLEDVDLLQTDMGWQFVSPPPSSGRNFLRIATTPTLAVSVNMNAPGNQTPGSYFYKAAVYTDKGRSLHTAASAELTATIVTLGQSAQIVVTARTVPALVRLWRGTTSGVYDRYVDVPFGVFSDRIADTGTAVVGYPWITTGVPTPPASNTTMDGQVVGRRASFNGGAAPTEGTWAAGDRVFSSAPSAGGIEGWVCTAGGTPGTWKTFGSIAA